MSSAYARCVEGNSDGCAHMWQMRPVVNYLIVIEYDGDSVAVEAVGSAVVTNAKVSPIDIGIAETSVESLPDEVRKDYKNAISRIVAKLAEVECPCECKYSAEQLVFELNQLKSH